MKHDSLNQAVIIMVVLAIFVILSPGAAFNQQRQISSEEKRARDAFEKRVKEYIKLRQTVAKKNLPKLSAESTPEQIEAYKLAFQDRIRAARPNAKPGELFTPDITGIIRGLIKAEFKGRERQELRETVLEADTQGVPLRVNYVYPETKELTQIPPTLLLELPPLPQELRYRFVGRHLLLVDRENNVIIDYMLNALP